MLWRSDIANEVAAVMDKTSQMLKRWRNLMTFNRSKTNRSRIATISLAALVLTASLPQASLAWNGVYGPWKVNTASSRFDSGHATLILERVQNANASSGSFIVISGGKVYRVMSAAAYAGTGVKLLDYIVMSGERAILIGESARALDSCGVQCQQTGLLDRRMSIRFKAVEGAGKQIDDMLARDGQKQ
jgi:hypothetical protein